MLEILPCVHTRVCRMKSFTLTKEMLLHLVNYQHAMMRKLDPKTSVWRHVPHARIVDVPQGLQTGQMSNIKSSTQHYESVQINRHFFYYKTEHRCSHACAVVTQDGEENLGRCLGRRTAAMACIQALDDTRSHNATVTCAWSEIDSATDLQVAGNSSALAVHASSVTPSTRTRHVCLHKQIPKCRSVRSTNVQHMLSDVSAYCLHG
jgi:hypothetical protein